VGRGADLGFVVGCWWNWGRTGEEKKDMIVNRNPYLSFTAYDSINVIKINTQANNFHNNNNFQSSLHGCI